MKKRLIIVLLMIFIFSLSSCNNGKEYQISDYILEMDYKEDFKILQLTDIHIANKDDRIRQYNFLEGTILKANADLIILSGDLFTFADKTVAKELFSFMDSFKIPWSATFGNHDEQCYFSIDWLTRYLNKLNDSDESYCIFKDIQDDDVFGNANFAINLMEGNTIKEQIIIMDSNRYNYGEYIGYDYIKDNQIEWYKELVNYTKELNSNKIVESVLCFHIPLPEWNDAWESYLNKEEGTELIMGYKNEESCPPKINTHFFDTILSLNSTKAIMVGHDHLNNFVLKYKGIILSYGVNSTDRIYFDENLLGGTTIVIKNDGSLVFDQIIRSYSEYE